MKTLSKIVGVFTAFLAFASVAGVSASFLYAEDKPQDVSQNTGFHMEIFNWEGAEVLPDDVQGEDHQTLIDLILNSEAGLNTPNSYLNEQISDRKNSYWSWDTYGSMDVYDATQMASIFKTETNGLTFLLEFPDDEPNVQYLYTTSVDLGESSFLWGTGNNIPTNRQVYAVYRTILKRDEAGEWVAEKSELGYAQSDWYDNNALGSMVAKCPSFDPSTWKSGKQGTSRNDSIYAYVGQTTTAYLDSSEEIAYYDLTNETAATRTITSYNMNCKVTVTNASGTEEQIVRQILQDAEGKDYVSVSWSASRNTTYYIEISGDTSLTFTLA